MQGRFILGMLFFIANTWCMEPEIAVKKSLVLKIMTYNTCNFYGMANKEEAAHITWDQRKDRICALILDEKPDIIGVQELRDDNGRSTIKDLWMRLGDYGYDIIHYYHNPSPVSYMSVIIYNKDKLALHKQDRCWLSDTPKILSDIKENGQCNAVAMATFYAKVSVLWRNQNKISLNYACPIHVVNVHNSKEHFLKMRTNRILVDEVKKYTQGSKGIVVITGDFNTLVEFDEKSLRELAILKEDGYVELLKSPLQTKDGVRVSGTFVGYSTDKYRKIPGMLGGQLDHIFLKKLSDDVAYESQSYVNMQRYNDNDNFNATTEGELLAGLDDIEDRDEFPSDHIPGIVDLKLYF